MMMQAKANLSIKYAMAPCALLRSQVRQQQEPFVSYCYWFFFLFFLSPYHSFLALGYLSLSCKFVFINMASKKAKVLVVDSNAFIKQVRIDTIGSTFYTIPQVISEIRDVKARHFLTTFPFEIITKDPTPAALKAGLFPHSHKFLFFLYSSFIIENNIIKRNNN